MISVQAAKAFIEEAICDFGTEKQPAQQALGRVLREELYADRDFPPFNRVAMDGIAIRAASFNAGQRSFPIAGIAAAGSPQQKLVDAANCLEVMTGCMLPQGADAVIRYEDLTIENGVATINLEQLKHWQNIHQQGLDRKKHDLLMAKNKVITAAELGVAATIGKTELEVSKLPRVAVISTGDELVDIHETPLVHQIRRSNVFRLEGSLKKIGVDVQLFHLKDELAHIVTELKQILANFDVLVLSGGVSMGKFDYLPKAFQLLGVQEVFHKVKQRPGKPFWFGKLKEEAIVFALPGNPVSSFMCTQVYVLPWLRACLQAPAAPVRYAQLADNYHFKPDLDYFLQVKLTYTPDGRTLAHAVTGNGSGDLANLVDADAFLQLPRGRNDFLKGEAFPYYKW